MIDSLEQFISLHRPTALASWSGPDDFNTAEQTWFFEFPHLNFRLILTNYNQSLQSCTIWDAHGTIRRRDLDPIRQDVRQLFNNTFSPARKWLKPQLLNLTVIQALERIAEYEEVTKRNNESTYTTADGKTKSYRRGWNAETISSWDEIVNNPFGLDVSTIKDTAHELLGQTPEEFTREMSATFRILHIESIVRPDLLKRFLRYKTLLEQSLADSSSNSQKKLRSMLPPHSKLHQTKVPGGMRREDIIADMLQPRVTFHGTPLKSVRSIIRHGFLKPGKVVDGQRVASPRSGISFDRGVYSSQSAAYALSYAAGQHEQTPLGTLPSMRLFVCATVMGRTYTPGGDRKEELVHGPLVEGYDSHFDGDFEYVVHDERAMLPCYVVHLDLGSEEAKRIVRSAQEDPLHFQRMSAALAREGKMHPLLEKKELGPGEKKREAEARKAAAMKWFPYGFGSATGTQFVIEEVGEVDDDEEDYGEWQDDKHAFIADKDGFVQDLDEPKGYWNDDEDVNTTGLFLDSYQKVRR
jgi:hypothetical protein